MIEYCRTCREWVWGSHYHCAHCGGVSSMYGHKNFKTDGWNCEKPTRKRKPKQAKQAEVSA